MIPAFTSRSLRGVLLLLAFASEAFCFASPPPPPASGVLSNTAAWFDASDAARAARELGEGRYVDGWLLFGGGDAGGYGDTAQRAENLPAYAQNLSVANGVRVANFPSYIEMALPDGKGTIAGTLTLSDVSGTTELLTFRVGVDVPKGLRLAALVDNLGTADYAPRQVALHVDSSVVAAVDLNPDGQPDWVFWDLPELKEGAVVSINVESDKGVATIGGLVFLSTAPAAPRQSAQAGPLPVIDRRVGEFSREGEYLKDYYVYLEGDTFHLFYNVGNAGESQQWFEAGNEKAFGHATSKDLKTWEHHPRVLEAVPGTWEGMVVSAPSIIKHDGTYYMFYTGFDDRVPGKQTIGLATSKDLFQWERYAGNPIYEAPEWAEKRPDGWIDCRDSHVIKYGDEFLMFTMVTTKEGKGAIALASSKDLLKWEDLGPAVTLFKEPESPRVFEHGGKFYMFATSAYGKKLLRAANPKTGPWEEIPFRWPAPGLWSGWETVDQGERTIFSAFEWKSFGNHIRFWDVRWKDEVPEVVY
jgi:predicted GH43/DUF377 family glycosyl hydrolase